MKHIILFLLFITSLYANTTNLEKISVQLKWFNQYQFAGIYAAKEFGYYKDAGLDVLIKERDPSKNNIMQVINGDSQYGICDSAILKYRADGYPVKLLAAIFQHNAMVLISKKESGILSPYEIKGKKISYQYNLDDSIISSLLEFAHLKNNDYIKKEMDFSKMDFIRGDVDVTEAYVSIEPYWMEKKYNIKVNIIDPKNYGIDLYGDMIFTTQDEIDKHPQRVEAFKKATIKGWKLALENPEKVIDIMLKKYNTRNFDKNQLLYESKITRNLIAQNYIPLGTLEKARLETLKNIYLKKYSIETINNAINSIIYDPKNEHNFFEKYILYIAILILVLFLLSTILLVYNEKLKQQVKIRTKELEKARMEAVKASEAKSSFLANMSHEIRTPMNAVMGFLEQLKKGELDTERLKIFDIIQDSNESLLCIINDILDLAKIQSNKMNISTIDTDLKRTIEHTVVLFDMASKNKSITIKTSISDEFPKCVHIDDVRIKQILNNLISNSIKFTPKHGTISIDLFIKENNICIEVKDNGIGIAEENLNHIFNAFEQEDDSTTRKFGGTGLGLSISKKLIELMNGTITVESELSKYTKFTITIPLIKCKETYKQKYIQEEINNDLTIKCKILAVEDNKTNQMLLSMILEEYNIDFNMANNGQEALDMFIDNSYDLILMDENMPIMNGIEATQKIRQYEEKNSLTPIPIIAVTANALDGNKEKFIKAGMDDFIAKPYTEKILMHGIKKYCNK